MKQDINGLEIKRLHETDLATFKLLIELFNLVFDAEIPNKGSDSSLSRLLGDQRFIALTALVENEVAGGLTAYELPMYYADRSEIFLYDLAVRPEYQRKGIGQQLIQALKSYCAENGIKEFFVMVHAEDEQAVEFYRRTGGKSENVINFLYRQ